MKEKFYKVVGWFSIGLVVAMFILTLNNIDKPRQENARDRWNDIISGDKASRESVNLTAERAATKMLRKE